MDIYRELIRELQLVMSGSQRMVMESQRGAIVRALQRASTRAAERLDLIYHAGEITDSHYEALCGLFPFDRFPPAGVLGELTLPRHLALPGESAFDLSLLAAEEWPAGRSDLQAG